MTELRSVTCHMGSHCYKVTCPATTPAKQAGTRFTYPGGMEGWVDLCSLIAAQPGIEPTTTWLQVRRPNHYATFTESCVYLTVCACKTCKWKTKPWVRSRYLAAVVELRSHVAICQAADTATDRQLTMNRDTRNLFWMKYEWNREI